MINSRDINLLNLEAKMKCLQHINACESAGIKVLLIQTLRDAEYQGYLYAQGRTRKGPKVTNCDGVSKKSNHQSGNAWDLVPLNSKGKIDWGNSEAFRKMADIAIKLGITAGYYFKSFKDSPHFEIKG